MEHLAEHVHSHRVEPAEGLVEHEQVRGVDERRGQLHALLVAERELLHRVVGPRRHPQPLEPAGRVRLRLGSLKPVQPGEVGELLAHAHLRVQAALLGHVPDPPPGVGVERLPAPAHFARVGGEDAEDDPHRRRLAGAVWAYESEHPALLDIKGKTVQGDRVPVALPEFEELQHAYPKCVPE
jgi:hypothetical protein